MTSPPPAVPPPCASDEAIAAIGCGLLDRTLPKEAWTHAAHFAATFWLLRTRPGMDLPREMPDLIRAYNLALGGENTDTSGYHETITQASIRAARAILAEDPSRPLWATCDALMTSPFGRSDWLLTYWTRPVLFSVAARRGWCAPDIRDLPF